jgi:DEAD/DEAH box helicase
MVGGTNQSSDLSKMRARAPDILVATPGRLNDNLQDAGVAKSLRGIKSLVFDEADRLLDMGFRCAGVGFGTSRISSRGLSCIVERCASAAQLTGQLYGLALSKACS